MNARTLLATLVIVLFSSFGTAYADRDGMRHGPRGHHHHDHDYSEVVYVPVIRVEPMIEVVHFVEPYRECTRTSTTYIGDDNNGATGTLLGGVIGGVIGHNLVRDRHQDAAIVVGTLLGASIGHDLSHNGGRPVVRAECQPAGRHTRQERVVGYRVTYRYSDRTYVTRTDRHPGSHLRISVSVAD